MSTCQCMNPGCKAAGKCLGPPNQAAVLAMEPFGVQSDADRLRAEVDRLRARVAELESAMAWRPIETAPVDRLIQLMVEDCDGERRTFIVEASYRNGEKVWIQTSGWTGWTKLHSGWTPIGWLPLTPPHKEQGNG